MRNHPIPAVIQKKNSMIGQHIEILNWHHANGKNQSKIAQHFDPIYPNLKIMQPLVLVWVKEEAKLQNDWSHSSAQ